MLEQVDLVQFVLYIAPGFLARQIYYSAYPGKEVNTFEQVAWSLFYSIWIVAGIQALDSRAGYPLKSNEAGYPHVGFIFATHIAAVAVGAALIGQQKIRVQLATRSDKFMHLAPDPKSIWASVNASGHQDWAVVFLDDGAVYRGYISQYRFDPNADDQDFLLSQAARVDETLKVLYPIDGIGVYLNTRNVKRIEFVRG